jgi:hypothetical protein
MHKFIIAFNICYFNFYCCSPGFQRSARFVEAQAMCLALEVVETNTYKLLPIAMP